MSRKDYDEIKTTFGRYISTWTTRGLAELDSIFDSDVRAYISTAKKMIDGSQDSIFGMRDFVRDFPRTDVFHAKIYNYVCRFNQTEAQQYAEVSCAALNYVDGREELDSFEFTCAIVNHWRKTPKGWRIDKMKMDVVPHHGVLRRYFEETWFLQDATDGARSVRNNCIIGELDSPWFAIPDSEDVLTEEEKIKEVLSKYAYGEDNAVFQYCYDAYSDDYGIVSPRGNREGKIAWITSIKNKRMKDRYWVHPFKYTGIEIDGDRAYVTAERASGHRQRYREYTWTRNNCSTEHCCGKLVLEYAKEKDGAWRLVYSDYCLGLYETGVYTEAVYGDLV